MCAMPHHANTVGMVNSCRKTSCKFVPDYFWLKNGLGQSLIPVTNIVAWEVKGNGEIAIKCLLKHITTIILLNTIYYFSKKKKKNCYFWLMFLLIAQSKLCDVPLKGIKKTHHTSQWTEKQHWTTDHAHILHTLI